jgi:hypothetical protein
MPLPSDLDILRCCVSRDDAVQVDRVERRLARELVARHDHARDPEEEDVGAGHQHVGRIERAQVLAVLVRPAERGERPEPGGEPGVEHVLVLPHRAAAAALARSVRLDDELRRVAVVAVPDGNAVPPPELPRDVPVADVLQPVDVDASHRSGRMRSLPSRAPRGRARRAAPSARTTGRRAAARRRCRTGSSAAPRAGASRPSRATLGSSSATMRSRASKRSSPRSASGRAPSASSTSRICPSASITIGIARSWRLPTSKSFASCAGVIFTTPGAECGIGVVGDHRDLDVRDRQRTARPTRSRSGHRPG